MTQISNVIQKKNTLIIQRGLIDPIMDDFDNITTASDGSIDVEEGDCTFTLLPHDVDNYRLKDSWSIGGQGASFIMQVLMDGASRTSGELQTVVVWAGGEHIDAITIKEGVCRAVNLVEYDVMDLA